SIRGSSRAQVQVYWDGMLINHGARGGVDLSMFPVEMLERVEIYRGFVPAALGGAMGGAIHLVSKKSMGRRQIVGSLQTGSWGTLGGNAWYGEGSGAWRWLFHVMGLWSLGNFVYFDDRGTPLNEEDDEDALRQNNDVRMFQTGAQVRWRTGRLRVRTHAQFLAKEQGLPGIDLFRTQRSRLAQWSLLGGIGMVLQRWPWARSRLQVTMDGRITEEWFDDRFAELGVQQQQSRVQTTSLELRSLWEHWFSVTDRLQVPLRVRMEGVQEESELRERSDVREGPRRWRFWMAAQYNGTWLPWLGGVLALRGEGLWSQSDQKQIAQWFPSGRIGMWLQPFSWLKLKANFGRYVRVPQLWELFGSRRTMRGNPDLRAESGWMSDLGV
ncbi:MAG: TonB-dependent receptor plug domain-containing protein, partial [Myxococcota bacterium]